MAGPSEHSPIHAGPLTSHPPDDDLVNPTPFDPPPRRNTASSSTTTTTDDRTGGDTCRICRAEATTDEPLFYPCKCSGSIKYVHQECLMEWLGHSHKKHCELCKTPFRFTKLYDAEMPRTLPLAVFIRRACWHVVWMAGRLGRGTMVVMVWAIVLPWLVRWAWRWIFWLADAGWAREAVMARLQGQDFGMSGVLGKVNETVVLNRVVEKLGKVLELNMTVRSAQGSEAVTPGPAVYQIAKDVAKSLGFASSDSATSSFAAFSEADTSILSSWTYLSTLTPFPRLNQVIIDICEGQLITCVVITGFILVFLIREWVVQQQPIVNLVDLDDIHQQFAEAAQRMQAENARLRRQQDLLEQARRRLLELQGESRGARIMADTLGESVEKGEYIGWDGMEALIDHATLHLHKEGEAENAEFTRCAQAVVKQIRLAGQPPSGDITDELAEKIAYKLAGFAEEERTEWEVLLLGELQKMRSGEAVAGKARASSDPGQSHPMSEELMESSSAAERARPRMPDRDFSSRATQIQRLLEEAETIFSPQEVAEARDVIRHRHFDPPLDPGRRDLFGALLVQQAEQLAELEVEDDAEVELDELPITNAGPDAKVNIRRSGKGKARAVPEPKEVTRADVKKREEEDETMRKLEEEIKAEDSAVVAAVSAGEQPHASNPFHPDGPEPEPRQDEGIGREVASELLAVDAPEYDELVRQRSGEQRQLQDAEPENDAAADAEEGGDDEQPPPRPVVPPTYLNRLVDWFWDDIRVSADHQDPAPADEERLLEDEDQDQDGEEQEAPLVPVANNAPPAVPAANPHAHAHHHGHHEPHDHDHDLPHDPEAAAAQQAALDADALEEAEDLEGILELIGLQGPLLGLLQTSTFCTILVTGTVFAAVGLPYTWGKLMLNLLGSPMYFAVKLPLQIAGFVADFVVDITLFIAGWVAVGGTLATNLLLKVCGTWIQGLRDVCLAKWIAEFAMATATKSGTRLQHLFLTMEPVESEIMGWNEAFLGASVHAHASLRQIEEEVAGVLDWTGNGVTVVIEAISSGTASSAWRNGLGALSHVRDIPACFTAGIELLKQYAHPLLHALDLLKTGSLRFDNNPTIPLEPSLIYWSITDRTLAVLTGYLSLALLAALYVALDTPLTRTETGRKTEKQLRDTLRQAGGVLKVILIISIEMLAFPFYCGLLLDLAFLPLFAEASLASRWAFAGAQPYTFCFVHWFAGTCYMFHFALFVGMCRKILRKGVLWFIRDPDDPTFHPVRDVLERNVATQLRKIAFSALVYGALVILCLGGVIWTIGRVLRGIFPIQWVSTEPVLEFPMDLLLYNAVTPLVVRLVKPSDAVNAMYAWWLRRCARVLRLSHFLFDDRRKDEEGHYVRKSWSSFLLLRKPVDGDDESGDAAAVVGPTRRITAQGEEKTVDVEVYFAKDGKYVLTPCSDQYRPPKAGEAFLHADEDDVYVTNIDGKKNDHFAKVYVPPFFRLRVTLFMVCLWVFSVFTGLCVTLVPLVFGRQIFAGLMRDGVRVNDIYAYSVGAYVLGGLLVVLLQGRPAIQYLREKTSFVADDVRAWTAPAKQYALQAVKCAYVYGFICVVLPLVLGLLIQLYVILPLHTYVVSHVAAITTSTTTAAVAESAASLAANLTNSALHANPFNLTTTATTAATSSLPTSLPTLASHTIHLLQDYCLGLLYVRIASRLVIFTPSTRAHEAFHRILLDPGYLNPNARAATRFLVAPVTVLATLAILLPPAMTRLAVAAMRANGAAPRLDMEEMQTKMHRYSYPFAAVLVVMLLCVSELGGATSRWRARIKDEVYLVGERLHNVGEKRPPVGSRSIMRKDR
ncbi:hypothetical protein B0A55_04352 [Friedmanniomyces simplex]|uniref:RING-type E3 ubiquitin transferase n=1 Tax=Friedmanniomyces simplex TaxID=329884 RepID=A0A4U0XQF0_9PEZI|nr:hypothetical protein B0A55_04352 [Friedmanniomyces simplex]